MDKREYLNLLSKYTCGCNTAWFAVFGSIPEQDSFGVQFWATNEIYAHKLRRVAKEMYPQANLEVFKLDREGSDLPEDRKQQILDFIGVEPA